MPQLRVPVRRSQNLRAPLEQKWLTELQGEEFLVWKYAGRQGWTEKNPYFYNTYKETIRNAFILKKKKSKKCKEKV
jgi:hypothetical protein